MKCNKISLSNSCPTRLLDVGTSSKPIIRLHITDQRSPASLYISLSHCWGPIQIKRLVNANCSDFIEANDMAELPETFRDAIIIARRLDVRYLWIDSLYIIQDCTDDWAKESITMGDVYKSALCNIAAPAAPYGRAGCFQERSPLLARTHRVKIESPPGPPTTSGVYDLIEPGFWESGINNSPLLKRAWVLQKRTLATRFIHFGQRELFRECHEFVCTHVCFNGRLPRLFRITSNALV